MKKYLSLLLALLFALNTFAACDKSEDKTKSETKKGETVEASSAEEESTEGSLTEEESSFEESEETPKEESDLHYHTKTYLLKDTAGEMTNTEIKNGALRLVEGESQGNYVTELDIGGFDTILASWNAETEKGIVEMSVSYQTTEGDWSEFLSWGPWSSKRGISRSTSPKDEYATLAIDIFTVNKGYTASGKIKVKLELTRGDKSPKVYNFSVTTPQMELQQTVDASTLPESFLNDVPMRSQLAPENGADGNRVCSPTTVAMALEFMGKKKATMTAAKDIYDNGWEAYGNWSFAVAYAGEQGFTAYMDLYDRDMMKYALSQGYVIGCSTYLTSSGHLVLLSGYTVIDGVEYYIANDPNVNAKDPQRTNYTVEYFEERWLRDSMNGYGVVYVFADKRQ